MLSPEVRTTWTSRTRRRCGWRCSGRCGCWSTVLPVEVPGPNAARCSRCWPSPRAGPCPSTTWWTRCGPRDVPESGRQALHTHVSRLRGHLGPAAARLQTRTDGYRLDLATGELDVTQARTLLRPRRAADPADALPLLQEAHALWRGPVLADLTDVAPIAVAVEGCARLHREVTDALIAAAVDAGRAEDVVGLATATHAADPLHEPARAPADARARRDRTRSGGPADRPGVPPTARRGDRPRPVTGARRGRTRGRGARAPPPRSSRSGRRRGSSAATSRSGRCTGCSPRSGW